MIWIFYRTTASFHSSKMKKLKVLEIFRLIFQNITHTKRIKNKNNETISHKLRFKRMSDSWQLSDNSNKTIINNVLTNTFLRITERKKTYDCTRCRKCHKRCLTISVQWLLTIFHLNPNNGNLMNKKLNILVFLSLRSNKSIGCNSLLMFLSLHLHSNPIDGLQSGWLFFELACFF